MKISKVINNNVLSAFDENGQEVVLMGRGLGFKAKTGDDIDESRVQKVFCIENSALSRQFQEMISNIPMEHMQISADIISYAKNECGMELNQSIYVALTDHINFCRQKIFLQFVGWNSIAKHTARFCIFFKDRRFVSCQCKEICTG